MKSSLDRKMDRILERENAGRVKKGIKNRALRKLFANKLSIFGFFIFFLIIFLCIFAPVFTPYSSTKVDLRNILSPPTTAHILGTDKVGRDIWARILYGGRISIEVGLGSALIATVLGVFLGTIAGYKGGWFDGIIMKISEILMSFPQIILVLILVTITGQSLWNLIFIFSLTGWPSMYRMARSQMLSLREEEYVQALKAFGVGSMRIASECHRTYICKYNTFYCNVHSTGGFPQLFGIGCSLGSCYLGQYLECGTGFDDFKECLVGLASNRNYRNAVCYWN